MTTDNREVICRLRYDDFPTLDLGDMDNLGSNLLSSGIESYLDSDRREWCFHAEFDEEIEKLPLLYLLQRSFLHETSLGLRKYLDISDMEDPVLNDRSSYLHYSFGEHTIMENTNFYPEFEERMKSLGLRTQRVTDTPCTESIVIGFEELYKRPSTSIDGWKSFLGLTEYNSGYQEFLDKYNL